VAAEARAFLASCAILSCSLALDANRHQCATDDDCGARCFEQATCDGQLCRSTVDLRSEPEGDAADARWNCLGALEPPGVRAGTVLLYRLRFEHWRTKALAQGPPIRLCGNDDAACSEPLTIPQPDRQGLLRLELDASFRGYLEVSADDLMPTLAFLPSPVVSPPEPEVFRLMEQRDLFALSAGSDIAYDGERGFAILPTHDCLDQRAAGVVVEADRADATTISYYRRRGAPDREAGQTDAQGAAGFSRLPAGAIVAEAQRWAGSEFIGVAEFWSRPGYVSCVPIGPTRARPDRPDETETFAQRFRIERAASFLTRKTCAYN
jgi:hypothetical protein